MCFFNLFHLMVKGCCACMERVVIKFSIGLRDSVSVDMSGS